MTHDHENEIAPFAQTNYRGKPQRFGIRTDDRRRHMYLVGKTGMGKTSMLEQLIVHDIKAGHGLAYLDPHGDTAQKILDFIPSYRVNDVVYFNPADLDWPISFNVLEQSDRNHQHLVTSGLIGIFKKIWAESWGPRLEYVLRNAILALMDYPGTTLLGIMRILTDKEYRRKVIAKVQDPVVKSFWVDEYARYPDKFQTEAIAPIQNKVGQFLSSPLVRNIVGQVQSTIHIRELMDQGKIIIMNLAKGGVGEDNSALLGAMMITKIYLAAMERVDMPEEDRKDFYLYVDEFQNFATDSFANILSEARKYKLNLTIAHQYIGQLMTDTSTKVRDAVFGNVGTMVTFRIGAQDAEFLEPEFMPRFTQEDLVNLAKYNVYMKLMIDGVSSDPFSATTLPPIQTIHEKSGNADKVIRVSRERYARPRAEVENKIGRWTGMISAEGGGDDDGDGESAAASEVPPGGEWQKAHDKARELTEGVRPASQAGSRKPYSAKASQDEPEAGGPRPAPSAPSAPRGERPMRSDMPRAPQPQPARPVQPPIRQPEKPKGEGGGPVLRSSDRSEGGWLRQAVRGGLSEGVDESEQPDGVRKVIRDSQRPAPEPRQVECAKCGGSATVFFRPRPGQRILCENCMRAEKEKAKVAEYEKPKVRNQESGIRNQGRRNDAQKQKQVEPSRQPSQQETRPQFTAPPPMEALESIQRSSNKEISLGDILLKQRPPAPGKSKNIEHHNKEASPINPPTVSGKLAPGQSLQIPQNSEVEDDE